jgi:transcriptional regulator with XRE-family HTH domain
MGTRTLAPQLRYIDNVHDSLGLTYRQIAAALGADESTLHRWRSGDAAPRSVFLSRLEALHELRTELLDTLRPDAARDWLHREFPVLHGRRPIDLLAEGRIEPLTRLLLQMNLGHST